VRVASETTCAGPLLAAIAKDRDRSAFSTLFLAFGPRLKAYFLGRGIGNGIADDLTQEVMLLVWRKAHLFDASRGSVSAWLFTIARNCFLNQLRSGANLKSDPSSDHDWEDPLATAPEDSAEQQLLSAETAQVLTLALAELPQEQADAIRGAYLSGRTMRELAEERQVPIGTMKTRVRLALERLRQSISRSARDGR
jgi:RNA polymerase sigma-70 factor, ECF subfamily